MWISLSKKNSATILAAGTVVWVGLTDGALAGVAAVPGPVAGAGLPALAIAGGALWLFRKLRSRRQ
jgi:hypothetical protein